MLVILRVDVLALFYSNESNKTRAWREFIAA